MKRCPTCNMTKEDSEFHKDKSVADGLCSRCKVCKRQYEINNCEWISSRKRDYFIENKERLSGKMKQYRKANRPTRRLYETKYREKNLEKRRKYDREYIAKKKQDNELFAFTCQVRSLLHRAMNRAGFKKSQEAYNLLGCSYAQLMQHLGPKPLGKTQLDHVCPISCAKTEEEALKLNHYSNLQWLPAHENLSKSNSWTPAGAMLHLILLGREWIKPPTTEKA